MGETFTFDGNSYQISDLSPQGQELLRRIILTRANLVEMKNQLALLMKAKNAYISDIKMDIVEKRSGVNLGGLLENEWE